MKKFWKFGLLAVTAAVFVACGDDSSSNASEGESSSSGAPIVLSSASTVSPVVFSNMAGNVSSNGAGGEQLTLSGNIKLDEEQMPGGSDGDNVVLYQIDSVSFIAGHMEDGVMVSSQVPVTLASGISFPVERFNLSSALEKIDLDKIESCGDFALYIWVYSSVKHDVGTTVSEHYSALDSISFTKTCRTEEPASSDSEGETGCAEISKNELKLSNELGTDQYALNFATGTAENPHVTLRVEADKAYLDAGTGVEIWAEGGMQDDGWAPETICKNGYTQANGTNDTSVALNSGSWYVAVSGKESYPFIVKNIMTRGSTGSVEVTYYK